MEDIYLLTKSVQDVQLYPNSDTSCARMLSLFVSFTWQNFQIEGEEYIAIAATSYGEVLRIF